MNHTTTPILSGCECEATVGRSLNSAKTQFGPRENDLFTGEIDNIIGKLADPKLLPGRAIAYEFIGTADTKEM